MFAVQLKYLLLFFASLCLLVDLSNETSSDDTCYFMNKQSNEKWKLVWQDNFQSDDVLKTNWIIDDGTCSGVWYYEKSCSIKENVKLLDGCLVMSAKEEKYGKMNFTGTMLTTKREFGYGRFEARTALSADRDVRSIFSTTTDNWIKDGCFIMQEFDNVHKIWHSEVLSQYIADKSNKFDIDYSSFHLYGMEWSENEVKFFVDDHYTEPILLGATRRIKPKQPIQLWLGVQDRHGPLLHKYNWKCPLWIVDYVRVYEKVSNPNVGLKVKLCEKQNDVDNSSEKQRELVNSICGIKPSFVPQSITQTIPTTQSTTKTISTTQSTTKTIPTAQSTTKTIVPNQNITNPNSTFENSSPFQWKSLWSNVNSIVYVTALIATLIFIVHLKNRITKLKYQKDHSPRLDEIELESRHQYESISYDDVRETTF